MTARTRRRIIFCTLVVLLTLPVESVLLQAVTTSDPTAAANQWASSLSVDTLTAYSDQIQQFPFIYRRAIMKFLTPQRRSIVWRTQINFYVNSHPDLPAQVVSLFQAMSDLATPENLSTPSAAARAQIKNVGDQLQAIIGKEEAQFALYRLGPRDGTFTSLEPTSLKLSNWVREKFIALAAAMARDCDCSVDWGCDGLFAQCKANTGCTIDDDWPACGWLWNWTCDGACSSLFGS